MSDPTEEELFLIGLGEPDENGKYHTRGEALRAIFDAGRASRGAEVAELTEQRNEWASRMMEFASAEARAEAAELEVAQMVGPGVLANAEAERDDAIARAEAAEAVIAAAVATIRRDQERLVNLDPIELLAALATPALSHPEPTEEQGKVSN